MTRDSQTLFTESQEQALLEEYKDLQEQIDIDNLPFQLSSLENLSQEIAISENCQYYGEEEQQIPDDKLALQQALHQSLQHAVPNPPVTPILGREEFAGPYNFQLILNHQNSGKHWQYSEKLSKVFINMEQVLPLQFQWTPPIDGLWVRATMVYKLEQHRSQPVIRCHNHTAPDNNCNRNIDTNQIKHVIRCQHNISTYVEAENGHLSVITPLGTPQPGVQNVPMDFAFYCKNSCTSGMNRRPTELIFTLETQQCQILGRRKLEIRVCSCPKRDKEKEEELDSAEVPAGKKRKSTARNVPPPGKKLATSSDNRVFTLNLNVVGKDNANAIVKYAFDVMAGAAVRSNNTELYKPYMEEILTNIQ